MKITPDANFMDDSKIYNRAYYIQLGTNNEKGTYFREPSYEYLVDFNELKKCAAEVGLKLINYTPFKNVYSNLKFNKKLVNYNNDEMQISFLYTFFAFVLNN